MTELLSVYENFYKLQQEYCVICFRSATERRMVDLKNLKMFIRSIELPFNYVHKFQRVCWMCERAAVAAFRLRLACSLSASVHTLFSVLDDGSAQRRAELVCQIRGYKPATRIVKHAAVWQRRLEELRTRTQLLRTDVLVVASVPPTRAPIYEEPVEDTIQPGMQPDEASRHGSSSDESDVYLIPDEPSPAPPTPPRPPLNDDLSEPEIFLDNVIIEDNERDPIEINHEDITLAYDSLVTTMPSHATHATPPASHASNVSYVTHATPPASRDSTSRRSSAAKVSRVPQAAPAHAPAIVPLEKLVEDNTDITSFLLHPIVETNGVMSVPSLNAQIINGQLITVDSSSLIIQTPKLAVQNGLKLKLVTEPNRVTSFLKGMNQNDIHNTSVIADTTLLNNVQNVQLQSGGVSNKNRSAVIASNEDMHTLMRGKPFVHNNVTTHSIVIEDDDDTEVNGNEKTETVERRRNDTDRKKRERDKQDEGPPKKQRETDWEDKIPMDVISYMDATDPNAMQELRGDPSLGFISSVQSVTEETHSSLDAENGINSVHGSNSVQTRIYGTDDEQSGIDSVQGISSAQPSVHLNLLECNSVQGINSVGSGVKGINSAESGGPGELRSAVRVYRRRPLGGANVHQNVSFGLQEQGPSSGSSGDVIDLC